MMAIFVVAHIGRCCYCEASCYNVLVITVAAIGFILVAIIVVVVVDVV